MNNVKDLLLSKGNDVYTIEAGSTIVECAQRMIGHYAGSLLVTSEGIAVGIVTWHDIVLAVATAPESLLTSSVTTIMTRELMTTGEDARLDDVEALMLKQSIRHMPVLRQGKVVGLITMQDVLKRRFSEEAEVTDYLSNYIHSAYPG